MFEDFPERTVASRSPARYYRHDPPRPLADNSKKGDRALSSRHDRGQLRTRGCTQLSTITSPNVFMRITARSAERGRASNGESVSAEGLTADDQPTTGQTFSTIDIPMPDRR
jgi:hypothetical protein